MLLRNIRQTPDKHLATIQTLDSLDRIRAAAFSDHFLVEFVEGFDVIRGEGDRDQDEVFLAFFDVGFYGVRGLRAEPGGGSDLGLPD